MRWSRWGQIIPKATIAIATHHVEGPSGGGTKEKSNGWGKISLFLLALRIVIASKFRGCLVNQFNNLISLNNLI